MFAGYTKIYFAENQLSLSLISLSPLTTGHPNLFQQTRVQSSNTYFYKFSTCPWLDHLASDLTLMTLLFKFLLIITSLILFKLFKSIIKILNLP